MEDAQSLRARADQAQRLGSQMTANDDRQRILAFASELYAQADAAEQQEAGAPRPIGPSAD